MKAYEVDVKESLCVIIDVISDPGLLTQADFGGDKNNTQSLRDSARFEINEVESVDPAGPEIIKPTSTESWLENIEYAVVTFATLTLPTEPPVNDAVKGTRSTLKSVLLATEPQFVAPGWCPVHQKYFDPLLLILFFTLFKSENIKNKYIMFEKKYIYYYLYFLLFYILCIIK